MRFKNKKIKIAFITDSIRDTSTGIGYYTKGFIKAFLQNYNDKVTFSFIDYKKTSFNYKNLIFIKNPFIFAETYLWHFFLPLWLKKYDFDFIFNFNTVPHLFAFKQKEIFVVHDLSVKILPHTHPRTRVFFYKLFFETTINNAYKILVNSEYTKKELIYNYALPEEKIEVIFIPYFLEDKIDERKPKITIKKPYILNVNTLEPRKNINSLLLAFSNLKKEFKIPHQLIICGKKGWGYRNIFALVKKLKLHKDVIFTGYVSESEKKFLFKYADIFVYPSYYEGLGIPILEAMYYGCPVVASNTSSIPYFVGEAGVLIDPNSVKDLQSAILKLIYNTQLKKALVRKGIKRAKEIINKKTTEENLKKIWNILEF